MGLPSTEIISACTTPPHTEKSPPVTVCAFWLLPKRPSCPTDASPSSRSVISDGKPSTPVKVVFFRVPLPRMAHGRAVPPSASLSRSLPLLALTLQPLPTDARQDIRFRVHSLCSIQRE